MSNQEVIKMLDNVLNALDMLEVRRKPNHLIVIASMNDLEQLKKILSEGECTDGNPNSQS